MNMRFKKFGGEYIDDIIEYLRNYIELRPNITIAVGCDSIQKRRRTMYAITIMLYDVDIKNGAHVLFYRKSEPKIRDNNERLYNEAKYLYDVGTYLQDELSKFYIRNDLSLKEHKKYKFHLLRCNGEYEYVAPHREEAFIENISLLPSDTQDIKLVDLHVDFNPKEERISRGRIAKNKSFSAYKSYVPWLRGMGFRVWSKPNSPAATSAADLLLKD
jgi:predicted RNase H-related nuclease YkuK (DUF458 family)